MDELATVYSSFAAISSASTWSGAFAAISTSGTNFDMIGCDIEMKISPQFGGEDIYLGSTADGRIVVDGHAMRWNIPAAVLQGIQPANYVCTATATKASASKALFSAFIPVLQAAG